MLENWSTDEQSEDMRNENQNLGKLNFPFSWTGEQIGMVKARLMMGYSTYQLVWLILSINHMRHCRGCCWLLVVGCCCWLLVVGGCGCACGCACGCGCGCGCRRRCRRCRCCRRSRRPRRPCRPCCQLLWVWPIVCCLQIRSDGTVPVTGGQSEDSMLMALPTPKPAKLLSDPAWKWITFYFASNKCVLISWGNTDLGCLLF